MNSDVADRETRVVRRLLGTDSPGDLAAVLGELGAILAVTGYRLLRIWLPLAILFHVMVFAMTGFWFLSWILLEVGLLLLFIRPSLKPWLRQNSTRGTPTGPFFC